MRHRIVEPKRIRRVCIEYTLNIMGLSLSSVATGQIIGRSLHILELITNSGIRIQRERERERERSIFRKDTRSRIVSDFAGVNIVTL